MTAPGNDFVLTLLFLLFWTAAVYAIGRLHQWYRAGRERDEAFQEGYDKASKSMWRLATRRERGLTTGPIPKVTGNATVTPIRGSRHSQEDRESRTRRIA